MKKLGTIEIFLTESEIGEPSYMATCKIGKTIDFETYNGYDKPISALVEVLLELTEINSMNFHAT